MHIVFAGGGAPGYWFPGLSVAHHVRATSRAERITFLGAGREFEGRNATLAGFQYVPLRVAAPVGGWARAWRFLTDKSAAKRVARRFLKQEQPDVVVGLGGPASAPVVRAAMSMGIPLVLLEYNALPSAVAREFAARAAIVFGAYPSLREQLDATSPLRIIGNPIRPGFAQVFRKRRKANGTGVSDQRNGQLSQQLLVLAGAGGDGRVLNESVPKALYKLSGQIRSWKILHQSGSRDLVSTRLLYRKLGIDAEVTTFIPDMPRVMLQTDVAITRPGAITLSELAAAMVPAVVVPSIRPSERHQEANAMFLASAGACRVVAEADGSRRLDDRLADSLHGLFADGDARLQMSSAIAQFARPDAAWQVASAILDLAHNKAKALQNVA